jgi:hypothetical protein
VTKFLEFSIDQEPIDPEGFYTRFDLEFRARRLSRNIDVRGLIPVHTRSLSNAQNRVNQLRLVSATSPTTPTQRD